MDRLPAGAVSGIVFDLEGTLVDFQWHLEEAEAELRRGLYDLGFAPRTFDRDSYATMWNRAVASPSSLVGEAVLRARLGPIYDRYDHDALSRWAPRPGAAELLARLHAEGYRLGMVSNIGRTAAGAVLERFGLAPFLSPVLTRDDVVLMKPAGEGVRRCLESWSLGPAAALMVGDSRSDLGAAREAGVPVAIILGGENESQAFAEVPPDHLLPALLDLERLLAAGR